MSSPVEEAMKDVELSESNRETTDSKLIIDLDSDFGNRPSTVVILVWDTRVRRAKATDVDRASRLVGWQLNLFL
ncbi:hypothetical protein ACOSQ2_027289 [Xanthoceras sorbifolium]